MNLSYDADGILRQKTVFNSAATLVSATGYFTDTANPTGYAQVLEERSNTASGTTVKLYAYGHDLISQSTSLNAQPSTLNYFAYDGLASVRELTDASGSVTDAYAYDAFGNTLRRVGTTSNDYLYRGERFDNDLGQYYLRARFYNQATGRFWNQDTYEGNASDPASLHKYLYAHANPMAGCDPSGMFTLTELETVNLEIATLTRLALPIIRAAHTAGSIIDFISLVTEVSSAVASGTFSKSVQTLMTQSVGVIKNVSIHEITESLLRHTPTLLTASLPIWGPWIATNYFLIDRYVIYMPTAQGVPYFEVEIPKPRSVNKRLALAFGAGAEDVVSKKAGRLTGLGVGLATDKKHSKQIWRMDVHPAHELRGNGDLAYFTDWPFHDHVGRPF